MEMESDTNNEGDSDNQNLSDDLNVTLPERPDARRLEKIFRMRAKLRKKQKKLEEREVDWENDEEEEQRLCDEEVMINKALVTIEMKLLKYKVLSNLPEDCRAVLEGGCQRIFITGTGNEALNLRLSAALKDKNTKVSKNLTGYGTYLSITELEEIVTSVREEQIAKGVTTNLLPSKEEKEAFDSLIQTVATIIMRAVKEARYNKDTMFDDYLSQDDAEKLRAETSGDAGVKDEAMPLEAAFCIIKQEGDAEKRDGVVMDDEEGVIVLSDSETNQDEEDEMDTGGSVESKEDQKPSATQLKEILNVKAEVTDNVSHCAVGEPTQWDISKDIKEELITQVMSDAVVAPIDTTDETLAQNDEEKEEEGQAQLEGENQTNEERWEAGDSVAAVKQAKQKDPVQTQEPQIEDQSTKAVVDEISPRDTVSPTVITVVSGSYDEVPLEKAPAGDLIPPVAASEISIADINEVEVSPQLQNIASQELPPDPKAVDDAGKEPKPELIIPPDETTSKPRWLKGETTEELIRCFINHHRCADDDDDIECVYENIIEHDPAYDKIDTSKNAYVWAWLENDYEEERERTPIEVIDLVETDEEEEGEEDENKEQEEEAEKTKKRVSDGNGDGEPPVRKARMVCDELAKTLTDSAEDGSPLTLADQE